MLASAIGTTIEWYDFLLYATAAALVFNKLFFTNLDPLAGTLAALGSCAVSFVARPFRGAIVDHLGDRIGRTTMLVLPMIIMGAGTFLIGCLPADSQIGIWAPILLVLLRLLQGIGIGGEWGGAVLVVLERSGKDGGGLFGSLAQLGFPAGVVLATLAFRAVSKLPDADFPSWGWRIPFLVSVVLVLIGLFVRLRLRLVETPPFRELQARRATLKQAVLHVLAREWKPFLIAVGMKVSEVAWVYVLTVLVVMYATTQLKMPRSVILDAALYAAALSAPLAFPVFALVETRDRATITLTLVLAMSIGHATMYGPQVSFVPELFGTGTRYSGASLGCQVSAALSGGFAPVIATGLLAR